MAEMLNFGNTNLFDKLTLVNMNKGKILVVDDNEGIRSALRILLNRHFQAVEVIPSPVTLGTALREFKPDAVLLDMNFQTDICTGNEGLYWLGEIKRMSPGTAVVLFTAYADIALAVEGMKRGAADFVVKPWDNDRLVAVLADACGRASGATASVQTVAGDDGQDNGMLWGGNSVMTAVRALVDKVADTGASVLITGENGTGKDVLAAEIHRLSDRYAHPMVCVDAGAIPETLFESELFGHVKGAFTDARSDRAGKIEQADGGTLFLDEIGNIPLHLQAKLLRALQNRTVVRVGDTRTIPVDIRLICATNRDIEQMVRNGEFREDLYYRINTIHIHILPLRERQDEIVPLAQMFVRRFAARYHRNVEGLTPAAESMLVGHRWNGNIRELQNCIEKAVILAGSPLLDAPDLGLPVAESVVRHYDCEPLEIMEEKTIRAAMEKFGGNLTHVAKSLNISRPTLYAKLKKYNI